MKQISLTLLDCLKLIYVICSNRATTVPKGELA